jgi:hypothetical protein
MLVLVLCLLLFPALLAWGQAVCTHWAASQGTGSACTEAAPCLIGAWLSDPGKAAPGKVLCLMDGHYTGEQSMLTLTARSGTEGNPLTIRALNDGKVSIDGQFGNRPLDCAASWITVQGVDVRDGNDTTMAIRGQHCTIQRVAAWSTQSWEGIENVIDIGGKHNLLEDVAAFGYARKMLAAGARGGTGPNTVRRAWVEHNGSLPGSAGGNPTNPVEIGYDQDNVTMENIIARRNILSGATEPEAPISVFSSRGSALLGSMSFLKVGDTMDTQLMVAIAPEAGSHAGSGHYTATMLVQDVVIYVPPSFPGVNGLYIQGGPPEAGNRADRIVAVAPVGGGSCTASGWSCTNLYSGTTVEQALGTKQVWDVAPGICYEYVGRTLTSTPLWPWRMQARIEAALASARQPVRNVTRAVEQVLGTIPPQCMRGTAPPIPPEPGPTPTPGPHPNLSCTGDLLAGGKIAVRCMPESVR